MSRLITIKVARVEDALAGLIEAEDFASAEHHWNDFLVYRYQVLEACDALGRTRERTTYVGWKEQVRADPALTYLEAARNAGTHTIAEIVDKSEAAISMGALGGYDIEVVEAAPGQPCEYRFIPQSDDPPPFLAAFPESIRLRPITGRNPVPIPEGYAYDIGDPPAPIALAQAGVVFMQAQVAQAVG